MADAGITAEHIRAGQEAMGRNPAAAAGSVEAGVIGDLQDSATQAGLEKAAMIAPSFAGIRSQKEHNIGHKNNRNAVKRSQAEDILATTATTRIDLLESFVNNGYANMGGNQGTIHAEVSNAILGSIEMASRFSILNPPDRITIANRMATVFLNDPNYKGSVINLLLQRADLTKPIIDQVSEVYVRLQDLNAEKTKMTQVGGEQPVAAANETGAQNRLNRYIEDPNGNIANNGVFYTEVATQTTAKNNAKNAIQTLETTTIPDQYGLIQSTKEMFII